MLDGVSGDQPRMVRSATGDDDDLFDGVQLLEGRPRLVEVQPSVRQDPAQERVGDRTRLFGDLLEHEVVVSALVGGGVFPVFLVDVVPVDLDRVAVVVGHGDGVRA